MLTLAAVADTKQIALEKIELQVERSTEAGRSWQTSFVVRMDVGSGLTRRERTILFNSARHCDVHKLVTGDMSFDYRWMDEDVGQ